MNDIITVRGFVATDVKTSTTPGGVATASFRLGSPDRHFDRSANTWVDGAPNWFLIQGYRQLAGNIGCSIKKGQRVIIVGRLRLRSWEKDGQIHHSAEINADSVGHDLMWGSANYIRNAAGPGPNNADRGGPRNGDDGPGNPDGNPYGGPEGGLRDGGSRSDADRRAGLPDGGESGDPDAEDLPEFDEETGELKEDAA